MRTEAQKRADKKYRDSGKYKYKNLAIKIHEDNLAKLKEIASSSNLTAPKYAIRAAFYCANNNIDLSQYDEKLHIPDDPKTDK